MKEPPDTDEIDTSKFTVVKSTLNQFCNIKDLILLNEQNKIQPINTKYSMHTTIDYSKYICNHLFTPLKI